MSKPIIARYVAALLLGAALGAAPLVGVAQIDVSVTIAPPPLPVYDQPPIPGDGYLWTPGYWAYGDEGYYWVPGTWVEAPEAGLLWTPGYWGWNDGFYVWNAGYWGPHIGFYGGVNYGFGYTGHGYEGGEWRDRHFFYNRAVNNVSVTNIHNVYNKTVINNVTVNNVSFNGGNGGISARPTSQEQAAAHDPHRAPTGAQQQHRETARSNRALLASVNQGKPAIAATARPGDFSEHVVAARRTGAPGGAPIPRAAVTPHAGTPASPSPGPKAMSAGPRPPVPTTPVTSASDRPKPPAQRAPVHVSELERPAPMSSPNSGDAARDQESQRQQNELAARHSQERQALQQKQAQDHQQMAQQQANQARTRELEQQHQQQTQQLQERHAAERQQLQRPAPRAAAPEPKRAAPPPRDNRRPE